MGDESDNAEADWKGWLTPKQALDLYVACGQIQETGARQIADRLAIGVIRSIAQYVVDAKSARREFQRLPDTYWRGFAPLADSHFWDTGDRSIWRRVVVSSSQAWMGRSTDQVRDAALYGVRFDPAPIRALLQIATPTQEMPSAEQSAKAVAAIERGAPLSRAEAEKFSKAILHGWPGATEEWVYEKALLFFPDRRVARDPFRVIFRAIRGPKKRGKQPKNIN